MIGGVLIQKSKEAGAGPEISVRNTEIGAVQPPSGGIGGIVARVADPGSAELRNERGLLEKRNFLGGNIQIRNEYLPKAIAIEQSRAGGKVISQLYGTLVA